MDLDGTLWDNLDVSSTIPPYRRSGSATIVDAEGTRISLKSGAVWFLRWAKSGGAFVSSLSWNLPERAIPVLEALHVSGYFDDHAIAFTPRKDVLLESLLIKLRGRGMEFEETKIFYIDDRSIHWHDIRARFPSIHYLHMWNEIPSYACAAKLISSQLASY